MVFNSLHLFNFSIVMFIRRPQYPPYASSSSLYVQAVVDNGKVVTSRVTRDCRFVWLISYCSHIVGRISIQHREEVVDRFASMGIMSGIQGW